MRPLPALLLVGLLLTPGGAQLKGGSGSSANTAAPEVAQSEIEIEVRLIILCVSRSGLG